MKTLNYKSWLQLMLSVSILSSSACTADDQSDDLPTDAEFAVNIFYPSDVGIDDLIRSSVNSMASPDFHFNFKPVDSTSWADPKSLADFLVSTQKSAPAHGLFLACKNSHLDEIGDTFRESFPKVPYVDAFTPALTAASVISYRYAVLTGTPEGETLVVDLIDSLGIGDHLQVGGSSSSRDNYLIQTEPYTLTTTTEIVVEDILALGISTTGSSSTDAVVLNTESIVLAGCEGFLKLGVASDAQEKFEQLNPPLPLQVINPIKAAIALLDSMIRNKVWISSPSSNRPESVPEVE